MGIPSLPLLRSCLRLLRRSLSLAKLMSVVGQAGLAHAVGQTKRAALGAGRDIGRLQLPVGAATIVPARLGHFSLRDRH